MIENFAGFLLFMASASMMLVESTPILNPFKCSVLIGMGFGVFFMVIGFRRVVAEQKLKLKNRSTDQLQKS
ncbi:MAG: hypothetical protein WCI18_15950 [Pseudomonadota bacterium]